VQRSTQLQRRYRGALGHGDGDQSERLDRRDAAPLAEPPYTGLNLVEVVYGNDDDQTSQRQAQALLEAHPGLQVIVSPTTVGIVAAAAVLEASGNSGTVQSTGLGTPNSMRPYVEDGTVTEFALWNVQSLGYLAYYVAAKLISGEINGNPGEPFSVPVLGDYTIGDGGVVVLGPPQVFTAQNIDEFNF
jgi:rhamnose transport system substrate-binding protein